MTAHDEAVEAAAKAIWGQSWNELDDGGQREAIADCAAQIAAYIRHMRAAGFEMAPTADASAAEAAMRERAADAAATLLAGHLSSNRNPVTIAREIVAAIRALPLTEDGGRDGR